MSSIDPSFYKLSEKVADLKYSDLLPHNENSQQETREFLQKIVDILIDYIELCFNRDELVLDFHQPDCLKKTFDMQLPSEGLPLSQLVQDCASTLKFQAKSGHLRFMNQLANGLDLISMAGDWLATTQNVKMFSYEVAPVFITMEEVVLKKMREIIGFEKGESTFVSGEAICNLHAVNIARFKSFPDFQTKGASALSAKLVVFTSDQSRCSIRQACAIAGIGTDNCIEVKTSVDGRMIPEELERQLDEAKQAGSIPILVSATAGTATLGSFDRIDEIASICEKHGVWLHVDASWGGALLLSKTYRSPRLNGIERADSITWNPDELMGTQSQCSTFHVRHENLLSECNGMSSSEGNTRQTDDWSIQCGRHNDIFKLWLQWRSRGDAGFDKRIDRLMELTSYFVKQLKERNDKFHVLMDPEFVNVCFWYVPKRLREAEFDDTKKEALGLICPKIKSRMMKAGRMMISHTRDGKQPEFFRAIISQEGTKEQDIDFMLDEIDRLGDDL